MQQFGVHAHSPGCDCFTTTMACWALRSHGANTLLVVCSQTDGFASDSMRMIKEVKKGKPDAGVQILLFSATFDDTIRTFANNIVGGAANQVNSPLNLIAVNCLGFCSSPLHCTQTGCQDDAYYLAAGSIEAFYLLLVRRRHRMSCAHA